MANQKKWIGVAIGIILIILAVAFLAKIKVNSPDSSSTPVPNKIDNVPSSEFPKQFPTQIPIESGAKIISNYNATSVDGRVQASRVFLSSKSVQANFDLYKNYLTKNGWTILGVADDSNKSEQKAIFSKNSSGVLTVTIYKATTGSTVDISFLPSK